MYLDGQAIAEEVRKLSAQSERFAGALDRLREWCDAYPLDQFPEPDMEAAKAALENAGISSAAVFASNARHVLKGIERIVRRALEGQS